jgi:hypothetical protein
VAQKLVDRLKAIIGTRGTSSEHTIAVQVLDILNAREATRNAI